MYPDSTKPCSVEEKELEIITQLGLLSDSVANLNSFATKVESSFSRVIAPSSDAKSSGIGAGTIGTIATPSVTEIGGKIREIRSRVDAATSLLADVIDRRAV